MNLLQSLVPDHIEMELYTEGGSVCCAFNSRGSLFAVGGRDGRLTIWDFETKTIAKLLIGHVQPVTSVSWSHDSRYLMTTSTDWKLIVWDVVSAIMVHELRFEAAVLQGQLSDDGSFAVATVWMEGTYKIDFETGSKTMLQKNGRCVNCTDDSIWSGDNKGQIIIYDIKSGAALHTFQLPGATPAVKSFCFSSTNHTLVNSSDKILRVYSLDQLIYEIQDKVNKLSWKKSIITPDGENIICGSAQNNDHKIYVWTEAGLAKQLDSTETLLDLAWHPRKPLLASCHTSAVLIWSRRTTENWSAFAPGFVELNENEEYIEREDEFDDGAHLTNKAVQVDLEDDVDIMGGTSDDDYRPIIL